MITAVPRVLMNADEAGAGAGAGGAPNLETHVTGKTMSLPVQRLDTFESSTAIRDQAISEGLISSSHGEDIEGITFFFDLNQGQLYTSADTTKIFRLVQISRDYADSDGYGEHNALLRLVADKTDLSKGSGNVSWKRPYHVDAHSNPDKWVALRKFLEDAGCDVHTAIYRDKQASLTGKLDSLVKDPQLPNEARAQEIATPVQANVEWSMSYPYCNQIKGTQIDVAQIESVDDLITKLNERLFSDLWEFMPIGYDREDLDSLLLSESLFNERVLKACEMWSKEPNPIVYWDIDDTIAHTIGVEMSDGSRSNTLFLRPALKEIFEFIKIEFPNIRHGVLTSRNEKGLEMFLQAIDGSEPYSSFFDSALIESCRHIYENLERNSELVEKSDRDLAMRIGEDEADLGNNGLRCKAVAMYEKIDLGMNVHLIDDGGLERVLPGCFAGGGGIFPWRMFQKIIDNAQKDK